MATYVSMPGYGISTTSPIDMMRVSAPVGAEAVPVVSQWSLPALSMSILGSILAIVIVRVFNGHSKPN
jgi:tetrahydromethanopterin S-methyltransferase subunit C